MSSPVRLHLRCITALGACLLCLSSIWAVAQDPWEPGALYREYVWTTPATGPAFLELHAGRTAEIVFPDSVELRGAQLATLSVERLQLAPGARQLSVGVNGHRGPVLSTPAGLPEPAETYLYHAEVSTEVPLEHLHVGRQNRVTLQLDTSGTSIDPTRLTAVILRVYQRPESVPSPRIARLRGLVDSITTLRIVGALRSDQHVDYVFRGRDVDWSGRGMQSSVHWQTYRGQPHHTIGRATNPKAAFALDWDASWLPEQRVAIPAEADLQRDAFGNWSYTYSESADALFAVQARLLDRYGLYHVGAPLEGLAMSPRDYEVHLLPSGAAPPNWTTARDSLSQTVDLPAGLRAKTAFYRLHWTGFTPCDANGLYLNDYLVWMRGDDCAELVQLELDFTHPREVSFLRSGRNTLRTGRTPKAAQGAATGAQVLWPGFQVKVRSPVGAPTLAH